VADNFTVLNSAGSTVTFRATDNGSLVLIPMSIPTNKLGTAMIGQAVSATSIPVVIASDQSNVPMNIAQVGGASLAFGQAVMANSLPVAISSNQSAIPVSGTVTAVFGGTAAVNLVQVGGSALAFGQAIMATSIPVAIASNQSVLPMNIASVGAAGFALGQTTMVNSLPVVIASNQSAITVAGTVTATFGGTAAVNLIQVGGSTLAFGQAVMATSIPVAIASNQSSIPITVADGSDATLGTTGNLAWVSGVGTVVSILKAIATNVSSSIPPGTNLIGAVNLSQINGSTISLGQVTMASSLPVVLASNQASIPVAGDVASGVANSGNPLQLGAVGYTTFPTAVGNGQRVSLYADKVGKLITAGALRQLKATQTAAFVGTAEATIINAINATTFADIYGLVLANTGATASQVNIRYGLGSAIVMSFEVPAADTRGLMLPVDSAIPGSLSTANVSWTAQLIATTNISVTSMYVQNI